MRDIRELAPKPSDAIKAMLDGLAELPRGNFIVDMGTYGRADGEICYGCAATCAVHKLAGKTPDPSYIYQAARPYRLDLEPIQLEYFEEAINLFRMGMPWTLFDFYGLMDPVVLEEEFTVAQPWMMTNQNWRGHLRFVREYQQRLVAAGF
jgi:hypothetical protein